MVTTVKKAMIMAAGVGTRLDPLTKRIPKPMIPVANKPILNIILEHLKSFGIKDVVANTHYLADVIHNNLGHNNIGVNFSYVYEDQLSGTAGGVKKCEWFFEQGETFVVVSGDALTDVNIEKLIEKHRSTGALVTMALKEVPLAEVKHFGVVVVDEDHRVIGFQEKPSVEEAKSNFVNTGIYVFETEVFKYIPADTFYDFAKNVFPALMANNELMYAHVIDEYWSDIGTLNQYRLSAQDVLEGRVNIDFGISKSDSGYISGSASLSNTVQIGGNLIVGEGTCIEDDVKLQGNNSIGKNCSIAKGASLRNCILWDNVTVEAGARLDGCVIASNSKVGANAKVLAGSIIPESCYIHAGETIMEDIKLVPEQSYRKNTVTV